MRNLLLLALMAALVAACGDAVDTKQAEVRPDAAKPQPKGEADTEAEAEPTAAPQVAAEPEPAEKKEAPAAKQEVPDVFKVKFECSNGDFVLECHKDWAPLGVERLHDLVRQGFYTGVRFFRVVSKPQPFVVQFGISGDPKVAKKWVNARIEDDPVKQSNKKGTVTFAMAGPNSRTTQVFINLSDRNAFLDSKGFAPIGKVVQGMETVLSFNDKYQDGPTKRQREIMARGNAFLDEAFPGLDYIKSATIIE